MECTSRKKKDNNKRFLIHSSENENRIFAKRRTQQRIPFQVQSYVTIQVHCAHVAVYIFTVQLYCVFDRISSLPFKKQMASFFLECSEFIRAFSVFLNESD
jgi:hypothetical protein